MGMLPPGSMAPAFALAGLEGRLYSLRDALAQGPLIVVFFKVSCPTCQYVLPYIERLCQQFHAQKIQVWGVSQDDAKTSRGFVEEYKLTFPVLIDNHPHEISSTYGLTHLPAMFLVDPQGQIVLATGGFDKRDLLAIHRWLAEYTAAVPPTLFRATERVPEYTPG